MKIERATLFELPDQKGRVVVCARDDGGKNQRYADFYLIDSHGYDILLSSIEFSEQTGLKIEVFDSEMTGPIFRRIAPPDLFSG